jgi:hypothetical protein
MSYDPVIPDIPKERARSGIPDTVTPVTNLLDFFETEPKIRLRDATQFGQIRNYLAQRPDTFIVDGSYWSGKPPTLNILMDTRDQDGTPTMSFERQGHSFRFRGDIVMDGIRDKRIRFLRKDFTEKDDMGRKVKSHKRSELDSVFNIGASYQSGFKAIRNKARKAEKKGKGDVSFVCKNIDFHDLATKAAYLTARNTYAFGVHVTVGGQPIILVFEPCEDFVVPLNSTLDATTNPSINPYNPRMVAPFMEFEYECKKIHGELPDALVHDKAALENFITEVLFEIREDILTNVPGLENMDVSKAEYASYLLYGFYDYPTAQNNNGRDLRHPFAKHGRYPLGHLSVTEYSTMMGMKLPDAVRTSGLFITSAAEKIATLRDNVREQDCIPQRFQARQAPALVA